MTEETAADRIRLLGSWLDGTGITLLELRTPQETILLRRGAGDDGPRPAPVAAATQAAHATVTAPSLGVFLHRHPLRDEPLVEPGQAVQAGAVLGLLRVGALLVEVAAPRDGVVLDLLAEDGSTVGYGAALVRLAERDGQ